LAVSAFVQRWSEHPALPRVLPFGFYILLLALTPTAQSVLPFDGRWLYAVQVGLVAAALLANWRRYGELAYGLRLPLAQALLAVMLGVAIFVLWINLDLPWAVIGTGRGFDPRQADGALDWSLVVTRIFGAAAVVPIMEELFWRSLVMRWIERAEFLAVAPASVGLRAMILSSLVFGFEHTLWFAGILAGIAYAWLYRRTENLWAPIVAHAVTNFLLGVWVVTTGSWRYW